MPKIVLKDGTEFIVDQDILDEKILSAKPDEMIQLGKNYFKKSSIEIIHDETNENINIPNEKIERGTTKDYSLSSLIMTIIITIVGFIITITMIVLFNNITGYKIHSLNLWFIIPIGAILAGAGASSGLFYSYLRYNKPIKSSHYLIGILLGVFVIYAIDYTSYLTTYITPDGKYNQSLQGDHISYYEVDGEPVTFPKYREIINQSSERQLFYRGATRGSYETGENVESFYDWIQLLGASIGAVGIGLIIVGDKKYCQKCKKYKDDSTLFIFNIDYYDTVLEQLSQSLVNSSKILKLIDLVSLTNEEVSIYGQVDLEFCNKCFDSYLIIRVMSVNQDASIKEVEKFKQKVVIENKVAESLLEKLKN